MVSTKRPAADTSTPSESTPHKKPRVGGFRVPAPANLPDGPWRRKAVKIKQELIVKSKIKKEYAKVKAKVAETQPATSKPRKDIFAAAAAVDADDDEGRDKADYEAAAHSVPVREVVEKEGEEEENKKELLATEIPAEPALHPSRIAMLDAPDQPQEEEDINGFRSRPEAQIRDRRRRAGQRNKPGYFEKELAEAERKKVEAEARAAERERREKEREKAIKERERHRRIMAKARSGGRDGKRKLGKESIVMLDRVKRLVGQK